MGKLHLAVRFSCANMGNMLHMYTLPLLPKMHYVQPLSVNQLKSLRYQAMNVVSPRLSRAEPPLGREVVEYMLDHDSHMWSMRKRKANFFRLMSVISGLVVLSRWFESMRNWTKPMYSSLFVVTFLLLVALPELITHATLLYMATMGFWQYSHWILCCAIQDGRGFMGNLCLEASKIPKQVAISGIEFLQEVAYKSK
ncbi:hypothetical protein V6N13_036796 [Hibiscus sabdariffa]